MQTINERIERMLEQRLKSETFRTLRINQNIVDFSSNDYLGLARDPDFHDELLKVFIDRPFLLAGSTGSRLISGHSAYLESVEQFVADKHQVESSLLFASGYLANTALFSSIPQRGDTVLMDECIHRSVRDGVRLSHASSYKFKHNDLDSLEVYLKRAKGNIFVAVESLYSMEGDFAPLVDIISLIQRYNAALLVDEAHAFGVFGFGMVHRLGLQHNVLATTVTYGKAAGVCGAAILADKKVISFLINHAASFIYTTSVNAQMALNIQTAYNYLENNQLNSVRLKNAISMFAAQGLNVLSDRKSPIQVMLIPGAMQAKSIQKSLEAKGVSIYAVVSPTVTIDKERIRIALHAFNTAEEIDCLIHALKEFQR